MDEVDGMTSSDNGGIHALCKIIEDTRMPVVCIANDGNSRKIAPLRQYVYELRFDRPANHEIIKKLSIIAKEECMMIELKGIEKILEISNNDIRQIINVLQLWQTNNRFIRQNQVQERAKLIAKDSRKSLNFYDATRVLFTHSDSCRMSWNEKLALFFIDWAMMPMISHENYLHTFVSGQADSLERMARCADLVSIGDIINTDVVAH
jgi:replication factor C subunit 1